MVQETEIGLVGWRKVKNWGRRRGSSTGEDRVDGRRMVGGGEVEECQSQFLVFLLMS